MLLLWLGLALGGDQATTKRRWSGATVEEDNVLILTDDNLPTIIHDEPVVLVMFYAPWCHHCKQMTPEFSRVATTLKTRTPPIPLAKLDCTVHTNMAEKYEVSVYPTLKLFRNGRAGDYEGPLPAAEMLEYLRALYVYRPKKKT